MITDPVGVAAIVVAACVAYMVWRLVGNPRNPALWAVFLAMIFMAGAIFLGLAGYGAEVVYPLPAVNWWISVASHLCTLAGLFCASAFFVFSVHDNPKAVVVRRAVVLLTAMAAAVLFAALASPADYSAGFAAHYAQAPLSSVYVIVFVAYTMVAIGNISLLSWRWSRLADEPWIRRGMVVGAAGASAGVVYGAFKVVYIVAALAGARLFKEGAVTGWLIGIAVPLSLVGLTVPGWGPRLAALGRWTSRHRAYRRLFPLWRAMIAGYPEISIELDEPWLSRVLKGRLGRTWAERWAPHVSDLDIRLHLRVVQIWDARRALLAYCDPADYRAALPQGADRAEAAMLTAALHRRRDGLPAVRAAAADLPAGVETTDLAANVRWLQQVARRLDSAE
ncbi:hypothetical protein PV458_36550 [Streptomyces sp. MN03-5084-2B]|nr:hypothetical protein [Streptomyces sp. MN03-5084-2B]